MHRPNRVPADGIATAAARAYDLGRCGPQKRQDRALGRAVRDLDLPPDLVHAQVPEHRLERVGLGVEPQLRGAGRKDPHVGQDVGLGVQQRGIATLTGRRRLHVVRDLALEELRGVRAGHVQLASRRAVQQARSGGDASRSRVRARAAVPVVMSSMVRAAPGTLRGVALADTFTAIVDSLPSDWTDLELDLRIEDESRYVEAAVIVAQCNGQPYSRHDVALEAAGRPRVRPRRRCADRAWGAGPARSRGNRG